MEIKIGIENVTRGELSFETEASRDEVEAALTAAITSGGVWKLTDPKGRTLLVPATKIGYVDLGSEHTRPVGFGALGQ